LRPLAPAMPADAPFHGATPGLTMATPSGGNVAGMVGVAGLAALLGMVAAVGVAAIVAIGKNSDE